MIPVQIEPVVATPGDPQHRLCGTCTKCGDRATVAVSDKRSDGTPRERLYAAQKAVLAAVTEQCAERLPRGLPPHHYDRDIPAGVEVFQADPRGTWLPCHVEEVGSGAIKRKALFTISGGCQPRSVVVVRPTEQKHAGAAAAYAERLRDKFGLVLARTVAAEAKPELQTAEAT